MRRFLGRGGVGGSRSPKVMHWGGSKGKGPPIEMNMFAIMLFIMNTNK